MLVENYAGFKTVRWRTEWLTTRIETRHCFPCTPWHDEQHGFDEWDPSSFARAYRGGAYDSFEAFCTQTQPSPSRGHGQHWSTLGQSCLLPKVNECVKQIRGGTNGLTPEVYEEHWYSLLLDRKHLFA